MGKSSPRPPPVPDPARLVEAQSRANRISQFTPRGKLLFGNVDARGNFVFDPAASDSASMVFETPFQREARARGEQVDRLLADQALDRLRGLDAASAAIPSAFERAGKVERASFQRALDLLNPELERRERRLRQSLADRGLPVAPGTAGGEEFGLLADAANRARQDAAFTALLRADTAADRAFQRESAARRQRFNELAALLGGQQVGPAGAPGFAPPAPPDVIGANRIAQQARLAAHDARARGRDAAAGRLTGLLGTVLGAGLGSGGFLLCWVAREIYGADDPRWLVARAWMARRAPGWLRRLYVRRGPAWAAWLRGKPRTRAVLRRLLDRMLGTRHDGSGRIVSSGR